MGSALIEEDDETGGWPLVLRFDIGRCRGIVLHSQRRVLGL